MPLLLASYKGVSFHTTTSEEMVGRRLAEHEYPNAEDWYVEDLGVLTRTMKVSAYISTDCEPEIAYAAADALRAVCQTPGPGPLILPPATFVSAHCRSCSRTLNKDTQGWMAFQLDFIEQGGQGAAAPFQMGLAVRMIAATMTAAVATIADIGGGLISSFGPDPEHLISTGDMVRTALGIVDTVSQIAVVDPMEADNLSQTLQLALNATTAFENSGSGKGLSPPIFLVVQPEILPARGAPPAESPTAAAFAAMLSSVADFFQKVTDTTVQSSVLATQLQSVILSIGQDPMPSQGLATYPGRVRDTTYSLTRSGILETVGSAVQILAGIAMCEAYASAVYARRTDAQTARGLMVATVEQIIYSIDSQSLQSHPGADELVDARDQASSAILSIIANLHPMVQMSLQEAMPSLYLAWRIYRDPNRAQELADRNDAPHPFFMPASFEALAP